MATTDPAELTSMDTIWHVQLVQELRKMKDEVGTSAIKKEFSFLRLDASFLRLDAKLQVCIQLIEENDKANRAAFKQLTQTLDKMYRSAKEGPREDGAEVRGQVEGEINPGESIESADGLPGYRDSEGT